MLDKKRVLFFWFVTLIFATATLLYAASAKETEHFRIMKYKGDVKDADLQRVANVMESVYSEVSSLLGATVYKSGRIEIRVCGRGTERASARRWGTVITLHVNRMELSTLRHELTHILIDKYFSNAPRWFHEGVAQYVGYKRPLSDDDKIPHFKGDFSFDAIERDFSKRDTEQERQAYRRSYAIVSYLVNKYGEKRLKRMFREKGHFGKRFRRVYGIDLEDFEEML